MTLSFEKFRETPPHIFRKIMEETLNPNHIQGNKGIGGPWLNIYSIYRRITRIFFFQVGIGGVPK
jgi:hypothetical protein